MMKRTVGVLLAVCIVTGIPFSVYAEEKTNDPSTVHFCTDPWPPFVIGMEGTPAADGVIFRLTQKIFEKIEGKTAVIDLLSWKLCLHYVSEGKKDGIPQIFYSDERAEFLEYTEPIFEGCTKLFYLKSRHPEGIEWHELEDLAPYTIGTLASYSMTNTLQEKIANGLSLTLDITYEEEVNWRKLLGGRFDLLISNETVAFERIRKNGWTEQIGVVEKSLYCKPFYMAFSKKSSSKELIPLINNALTELKEEGVIQKIVRDE